MIELIVALAVASQIANETGLVPKAPPVEVAARDAAPLPPRDPDAAVPNFTLDPAYLLDPSLPVTFVQPPPPAARPAPVSLGRAMQTTGPESDEAFQKATLGDYAGEGRQEAPDWVAGPAGAVPGSFGAGADLRGLAGDVRRTDTRYRVGTRQVRLEIFRPALEGPQPAVLLLHGASGMGDGAFYRGAAGLFASQGYVVYLPHYLGERNRNRRGGRALIAEFEQQHDTVRAALDQMTRDRDIDARRLGVFGFSLGGFQAMGLSSRDARVGAIVNMGGGVPGNVVPQTSRLAPTLIVHGAQDRTVPVARAHLTRDLLRRLSVPHEMALFRDQGHFFRGPASRESIVRSVVFFDRHLRAPEPVDTGTLLAGM